MTFPLPGSGEAPDPSTQPSPAGWDTQRPSTWSAIRDTAATLPRGTGMRGAYQAGKVLGQERAGGVQPSSWGNQGDGGEEATNGGDDPHADINAKLDSLQESVQGMQSGGGAQQQPQNRMEAFGQGQQGGPQASGTQRPGAPNALTVDHQQQALAMQQYQANTHASVSGAFNSLRQRAANWSAQTPGGVQQTGTGNGMSSGMQSASMSGALGGSPMRPNSGIGQSQSSFENTRFMGGQS